MSPKCCVNDKYEDCMVQEIQCFNTTACNFTMQYARARGSDLRHKLSKFLQCFEGGVIAEGKCPGDALKYGAVVLSSLQLLQVCWSRRDLPCCRSVHKGCGRGGV